MLHVFSLSVAAELSVAATNRWTPVPPTVNTPAPRQTRPSRLVDHLPLWESVVINGKFLLKIITPMESGGWTPRTFNICTGWGTAVISFSDHLYWAKEIQYCCLAGWVGHSEDLKSYREMTGGGLRTGEACSTANIMLKIGHGLLQTW
jgi:hypothetical protein